MRREDKILRNVAIDTYWRQLYDRAIQKALKGLVSQDCMPDELDYRLAKEFSLKTIEKEIYYNRIASFADTHNYPRRLMKQRFRFLVNSVG